MVFFFVVLEECSNPDYTALVNQCIAFIRKKCLTPTPTYLRDLGITLGSIIQFPGRHVVVKPKVPHMVFNIGESVAEATNFSLEDHAELLNDVRLACGELRYKFLVCRCRDKKPKKQWRHIPRIELKSLAKVSSMRYDERDKKTAGKRRLTGAKKNTKKHFHHRKVNKFSVKYQRLRITL